MKIDANDPRWTAYALDEIKDDQERAELETILQQSPEMRRLVEEIRNAGELLSMHLHVEPALHLSQEQRAAIEQKANSRRSWFGLRPAWVLAGAAAAMVIVSVIAFQQLRTTPKGPGQGRILAQLPGKKAAPEQKPQEPSQSPFEAVQAKESMPGDITGSEKPGHSIGKPYDSATVLLPALEIPAQAKIPEPAVPADTLPAAAPLIPETAEMHAILAGTLKDSSGAVLPGATVRVIDKATGVEELTKTNPAGDYYFQQLSPGPHTLTAELPGFQKKTITDIPLLASSPTKLDLNLEVGKLENTIEVAVSSENLLLESSSSAGNVRPQNGVRELPMVNSNAADLVKVMGGAAGGTGGGIGTGTGAGLGQPNVQRDGITVSELRYPAAAPPPPPRIIRTPFGQLPPPPVPLRGRRFNTESYDHISDNPFLDVTQNPLSTFSVDVDTASYSNVRRFLENGQLPPKDSVRIEELVNYFDYDYKGPKDEKPFAANFELTEAPWNTQHRLLRIGLKGREVNPGKRPNSNLVFLLDVSGSMMDYNKLPFVKQSMNMLLSQLTESDRVAIVVYATEADVWLPSTSGDQKERIRQAINRLQANGSTNGASGIQLAYRTAQENFIRGGTNRVILATDGDFNVGITNRGDLSRLIEEKAKTGIFLSALGFGMGNLKDATLEMLAKNGHGNYAYIDTLNEARKVLVDEISSTLVPIAKDVKIQVEFNPRFVSAYRLIGYEDRLLAKEDFNDDSKDAGVIGAGHKVTALYELVPSGIPLPGQGVDPLKYQKPLQPSASAESGELVTVKIRSKDPEKDRSVLSEFTVKQQSAGKFVEASRDFKFAAAVAAFGMILRDSPNRGSANLPSALEWANEGIGADPYGYRQEFVHLIRRTMSMVF